ncbi:hypothetical protein V1478_008923 [Vespula squamosa]|uniref:Uncharacterized protein n=1 Tax=Vespula squamosa TaxID=30214 RepID=A0ABD2AVA4_VESSQ
MAEKLFGLERTQAIPVAIAREIGVSMSSRVISEPVPICRVKCAIIDLLSSPRTLILIHPSIPTLYYAAPRPFSPTSSLTLPPLPALTPSPLAANYLYDTTVQHSTIPMMTSDRLTKKKLSKLPLEYLITYFDPFKNLWTVLYLKIQDGVIEVDEKHRRSESINISSNSNSDNNNRLFKLKELKNNPEYDIFILRWIKSHRYNYESKSFFVFHDKGRVKQVEQVGKL